MFVTCVYLCFQTLWKRIRLNGRTAGMQRPVCAHTVLCKRKTGRQMIDVEDMVLLGQVGYLFKIIKKKSQEEKIVTSVKELH